MKEKKERKKTERKEKINEGAKKIRKTRDWGTRRRRKTEKEERDNERGKFFQCGPKKGKP